MELKLKRRELRIDAYGEPVVMRFPTVDEQDSFSKEILADGADEKKITIAFFVLLGMKEKIARSMEQPDLIEIGQIVTGQKKI